MQSPASSSRRQLRRSVLAPVFGSSTESPKSSVTAALSRLISDSSGSAGGKVGTREDCLHGARGREWGGDSGERITIHVMEFFF